MVGEENLQRISLIKIEKIMMYWKDLTLTALSMAFRKKRSEKLEQNGWIIFSFPPWLVSPFVFAWRVFPHQMTSPVSGLDTEGISGILVFQSSRLPHQGAWPSHCPSPKRHSLGDGWEKQWCSGCSRFESNPLMCNGLIISEPRGNEISFPPSPFQLL